MDSAFRHCPRPRRLPIVVVVARRHDSATGRAMRLRNAVTSGGPSGLTWLKVWIFGSKVPRNAEALSSHSGVSAR